MQEFYYTNNERKRSVNILIFVLLVTFGFGIGGAIGGAVWVAFDAPHFGFAILGAIGGTSLGVALREWRKVWVLALAGAIGFDIGLLMGFFVPLNLWGSANNQGFLSIGIFGGVIGGTSIGIVLKSWKSIGLLSLTTAIGLCMAVWLTWDTLRGFTPQILGGAITLAIWGLFGGLFIGLTLGLLKKRNHPLKV